MANVQDIRDTKQIVIELGGKERKIVFDMNALAELETIYGSIEDALKVLEGGKLKDVRNLLWAGICHEEIIRDEVTGDVVGYNIRPYDVGAMITTVNEIPAIAEKLFKAISKDMGDEKNVTVEPGTESKNQ